MATTRLNVHSPEHTGRIRAAARALAQDINLVLREVPEEVLDHRVRALFARDVRRAHQVLKGKA